MNFARAYLMLFIIKINPKTKVKDIPRDKLAEIVIVTRLYSWDFYEWKKV